MTNMIRLDGLLVSPPARGPRRPELWAHRWMWPGAVRRLIEKLDPEEHDAEIVHLSLEVLTPKLLAHAGYVAAALRTLIVPRVAERIVRGGAGKQLREPRRRDHDTLATFATMIRHGHRSHEGRAVCERITGVHAAISGIENEDQLYTLGQLMFAGEELSEPLGIQLRSEREQRAAFSFWRGIGHAMGLTDMPASSHAFRAFMRGYEDRYSAPSEAARSAAAAHLRGLDGWCLPVARPWLRSMVLASLSERTRACIGYPAHSAWPRHLTRAGLRLVSLGAAYRPVLLAASLAEVVPHV